MKMLIKFQHYIFKLLPAFRGKLRIARLFIWNKKSEQTFITNKGIKYSCPNLIETVSLELFVNGIYEKDTIKFICNSIPFNGIFIDVGANIGAVCIEVAIARPDVSIYAFEASPNIFGFLKKNQEQNKIKNLFVFNIAIHEHNDIELPFFSPKYFNGQGSFLELKGGNHEMVKTLRLERFFDDYGVLPDFIKIDVEGYELLVLKSLSNFLISNKPTILFEFISFSEEAVGNESGAAQNYLLDYGYSLTSLHSNKKISNPIKFGSDMIIAKI